MRFAPDEFLIVSWNLHIIYGSSLYLCKGCLVTLCTTARHAYLHEATRKRTSQRPMILLQPYSRAAVIILYWMMNCLSWNWSTYCSQAMSSLVKLLHQISTKYKTSGSSGTFWNIFSSPSILQLFWTYLSCYPNHWPAKLCEGSFTLRSHRWPGSITLSQAGWCLHWRESCLQSPSWGFKRVLLRLMIATERVIFLRHLTSMLPWSRVEQFRLTISSSKLLLCKLLK